MKNIVILISGTGSNMAAIVRAAEIQDWAGHLDARVAAVISNRANAGGLVFAREHGIATQVLDHKEFASREAFDSTPNWRRPSTGTRRRWWCWRASCASSRRASSRTTRGGS